MSTLHDCYSVTDKWHHVVHFPYLCLHHSPGVGRVANSYNDSIIQRAHRYADILTVLSPSGKYQTITLNTKASVTLERVIPVISIQIMSYDAPIKNSTFKIYKFKKGSRDQ